MFLDKIVATKRNEVDRLAAKFNRSDVERTIADMTPCLGFERAVTIDRKRGLGLIAEVKKASPSKGLIRPDFDPVGIAKSYEAAGADCISVLTDRDFFQGSNDYLRAVREVVNVPILRKDFIIDYRQVYEARVIGADAVLLIAAILSQRDLNELYSLSKDLGLDVLVEVHDEQELDMVLDTGKATLIGINNRNLHTFETSIETTGRLMSMIPQGTNVISESALSSAEDLAYVREVGAAGVLIGEHFMRYDDVGVAIERLMGPVGSGR